jgi:hypothetical protein
MGTQKGGTTSLYDALCRHPMMGRASRKELHFFDRYYHDLGWSWYRRQFTLRPSQSQVGEATPAYMYLPSVRERIANDLPDIKIVITLRDPVSRAYSHYWHSRRHRREPLATFEEALAAESDRLAAASEEERTWWSYTDRGRYVDQVEAIAAVHGRSAVCVVTLEELRSDPRAELSRVLRHLRLDPDLMRRFDLPSANAYQELRPHDIRHLRAQGRCVQVERTPSTYPPMAPATRRLLAAAFAQDDRRLSQWLGRPVPWRPGPG